MNGRENVRESVNVTAIALEIVTGSVSAVIGSVRETSCDDQGQERGNANLSAAQGRKKSIDHEGICAKCGDVAMEHTDISSDQTDDSTNHRNIPIYILSN